MDRARNQRIEELFERAVDLATAEQASLLDRECPDAAERRAVERLLEAEKQLRARDLERLLEAEKEHQARGRAVAPRSFRPPVSTSGEMPPTARPAAAGAGGGSSGGSWFSDTTNVEAPSGSPGTLSATGETATPGVTPPRRYAIDVGAVIGRYRVVERIGHGGMGIVYRARHEDLGHDAVVKVLHHAMTDSDQSVQRFMDEARIAAGIRHPGVVQVIDVGRHESGALFILMERLYGESLQRRLERKGKLAPRTAIGFALQTARALDAVHATGVVHRDLKPDNLYLVEDPEVPGGERVKILDFGIAKLHSRSSELTQSHVAMGTPPYMAPEQCMSAARVDSRADLYSLGVLLFEMLCGRRPFRCQSFGEYILAHTRQPPPPVQRFAQVSPALARVVERLLAKRPEERFGSAGALIMALDRVPELRDGWEPGDPPGRISERSAPSSLAPTTPAQPGARPGDGHSWTSGRSTPATDPEAGEAPGATPGTTSGGSGNTRPEPVDEPAATSPVVIPEVPSTSPVIHAPWTPAEPGGKVDTLGAAPGEAAQPAQGDDPARRSRVAVTLRWVCGLVPAGGLAALVVATSVALVASQITPTTQVYHGFPGPLDAGTEEALPPGPNPELRQELVELLDNGSEAVQRELIDAIRDVGTSEAAEVLYRALGTGAPAGRLAASHALCTLGWRDGAPRMREAMRRSGGSLRVQLAANLLCLGDREAIDMLEDALDDEAMSQLIAAEALARAGQRELARPALARALAGSEAGSEPWQRAARGLLRLDDAGARAALRGELARPEPGRALAAAESLAGAGDRAGLDHLDRVLADSTFTHRAEAALALARHLGDGEAARFADRLVAFVRSALGSRHPHERRAAAAVLGRLAGYGGYLDAAALEALLPRLEALRDDSSPDAGERAVRITARVALLAVYRALSARNSHE